MTASDVEHVRVDLRRSLRPQHGASARGRVALEDLEPYVEIVQRTLANRPARFARGLEIVELGERGTPFGDKFALDLLQIALKLRVRHVGVRALLEMHRSDLHC